MANVVGGTIVWNLDVDKSKLTSGLEDARSEINKTAAASEKTFASMAKTISTSFDNISKSLNTAGDNLLKFGAPAAALLTGSAIAAVKFEDSLADVRKTTGLTADETAKLGRELMEMSKNTRTATGELVDIAKIAGQLGVTQSQLLPFTEAVNQATVALGDEFIGGAEQVTKELGILANQFQLTGDDGEDIADSITKIGSALNALGASGAATAPFISDFGNRVGGIAPLVGMTIDQVFGLGAALQELGQSPEVAGTAVQSILVTMGKDVASFAKIAGKSTKEFSALMRTDVNEALLLVAAGVAKDATGIEELSLRLDSLGIDGQRVVAVLANMGNNVDLVRKRQALASEEFEKGTSLINEYNIKNSTAAAQLGKFRNQTNALAVTMGNSLLPALNDLLGGITPVVEGFSKFAEKNPKVVSTVLILGTAVAGLGLALKGLSIVFGALSTISNATSLLLSTRVVKALGSVATTATTTTIPAILRTSLAMSVTAVKAVGTFVAALVTQMIPALLRTALTMSVNAVQALAAFSLALITQTIPALLRTALVMTVNFLTAIGNFEIALVTKGIPALIRFAVTTVTQTIPAILQMAVTLSVNAVQAAISFTTTLLTQVIPALIRMAITFTVNAVNAVVTFATTLITQTIPAIIRTAVTITTQLLVAVSQMVIALTVNAVRAVVLFAVSLLTTGVPALAAFVLGILAGVIPALFGMAVAIFTTVIPALIAMIIAFAPLILGVLTVAAVIALLYLAWKNNFLGIRDITKTAINAITGFISGLWNDLNKIIGKIGELLQKINPFHRSSPSLVDNVMRGIDVIKKEFGSLGDVNIPPVAASFPQMDSGPDFATSKTLNVQGSAPSSGSGVTVNIAEANVKDQQDVEALGREFGFRYALVK